MLYFFYSCGKYKILYWRMNEDVEGKAGAAQQTRRLRDIFKWGLFAITQIIFN